VRASAGDNRDTGWKARQRKDPTSLNIGGKNE
jgi:hypothetical protein